VAAGYVVSCWNCLGEFEATGAVWCSDDPKNPTKLCPFCLHCFCEAGAEYKQEFWKKAPPQLVEELQTLGKSQDRLGDVLIRMKKLQTPQLLDALVEQRETGRKLGEILIGRGLVTAEDVESALRSQGVNRLEDTRAGDASSAYWQQSTPDGVLDYLLVLGARKRASDLSLAPEDDQIAVRYRIDGFSFRVDPIPRSFEDSLERALFAMFSLDPARRTRPQSGRSSARLGEDDYDLLIQTVPGAQGLSTTIKLVNRSTFIKDFATLGLEMEDRVRLVEEVRSGLGMILVSSPAYDGASTTCYSIMSFLAQGSRDVLSIESPIQWTVDGVRQVEAEGGPAGPRMEETLRAMAAVRPDVLMLSAIPDYPTLLLATQLASSRLVVAKGTSASAARALVGLREMGAPPQLLSGSLGLVLGQRLIRTLCRICRVEAEPPPAPTLEAHGIDRDEAEKLVFYKGKGCPTCNTIGYRGRRAIFEAIPATPEVRASLERSQNADQLEAAALESGMISIRERALGLVRAGVTSFDEFARLRL